MEDISPTCQTVICEEIFDDSSHPSVIEVRDYASKIGIDPELEPQLLPLAEEALMKPLPPSWKPCYDDKKKSYYYHNIITGKTQWEHPLDDIYRDLVIKVRTESQSYSLGEPTEDTTYTRDDIPSYEEPPPLPQFGKSLKDIKLSPLKTRPKLGELNQKFSTEIGSIIEGRLLSKQKSEDRPSSANRKVNLSLFNSLDDKNGDPMKVQKQELTVTGGGSIFLKTNTKKSPEALSLPLNKIEPQNSFRGILRENAKNPDGNDRIDSEKLELDESDKKSVRFNHNIEINPDFSSFTLSDESESELKSSNKDIQNVMSVQMVNKFAKFPGSFVDEEDNGLKLTTVDDEAEKKSVRSLKLVKPYPKDFIKPSLDSESLQKNVLLSTNSDDDSETNGEGDINIDYKNMPAVSDFVNTKTVLKEAELEIQKYKEKLLLYQQEEKEKILKAEKTQHDSSLKNEVEKLRDEMDKRLKLIISEEKVQLELKLSQHKLDAQKKYEGEEENYEQELIGRFELKKKNLETLYNEKFVKMERELEEKLDKTKDELIVLHNAILDQIRQNHAGILDELQKDFKAEEDIIRREHQKQISELKNKVSREIDFEKTRTKDVEEERLYEKVRCEKRLLEDKYRCLKDKYLKLKTEVKLSIEKRNRKREQINANTTTNTTTTTTGSDTEKSPMCKKADRSPMYSPSSNKKNSPKYARSSQDANKHKRMDRKIRQVVIQDQDTSASDHSIKHDEKFVRIDSQREYDSSDLDIDPGRSRKKLFTRIKSSSASRINNNINAKETQQQRSCSPVENLRKQLQKLEDLEDQFPQNAQGDTYHLRYPFSDGQKFEGSSELEFFRHRIHLERDSIRRAKESLRLQKTNFKQRQHDLKLRHGCTARNTLKLLYQEEKELTDMEVSLHRTRSLLGEKVIRLRHLEQSLQHATVDDEQIKQDDATLSDLSSHSASSGISSTEFVMVDSPAIKGTHHLQESSEIIQSLENLNSEIREIWEVLNKQHQASSITRVLPPLPLLYPDLGWPLLAGTAPVPPSIPTLADRLQNYRQHIALANAQSTMVTHDTQGATTTLVEKTRNLRQWLRHATVDNVADGNVPQATL